MQAKAGRPLTRVLLKGFLRYENRLKDQGCPLPPRVHNAVFELVNALEASVNTITDRMEGEPPSSDDRTADRYAAERRRLPRFSRVHARIAPVPACRRFNNATCRGGIPYCASTHSGGTEDLRRRPSHLSWPPHRQDVGKRGRCGAQCGQTHGGLGARGLSLVGGVHDRRDRSKSQIAALRPLWTTRDLRPRVSHTFQFDPVLRFFNHAPSQHQVPPHRPCGGDVDGERSIMATDHDGPTGTRERDTPPAGADAAPRRWPTPPSQSRSCP